MEITITGGLIVAVFVVFVVGILFIADAVKSRASAELSEMTRQRDYWRAKAESLIDAALARAGAIHQPTMETRPPADRITSGLAALTTALSVTEIDSSKSRKAAS